MKKIFKRFAAAVCSGAVLSAASALPSFAEHSTGDTVLPSGMTVAEVEHEMNFNEGDVTNATGNKYGATAVGIFKGDEVLLEGYYAKSDIENDIHTNKDTVFEWGSISKTLVWVSAMQLWEQGKLDLERDVRGYLPEGFFQHLTYDEPITMLDLMNHRGGWQETTRPLFTPAGSEILSLHDELQAIEPEQVFRPGEVTAYSNYGAAVAGYVVECISGMDYCDYVHKNILEPLDMEHTSVNADHSDNEWVYEHRKNEKCYEYFTIEYLDLGNQLYSLGIYPAGAATGTMSDLMTYAQALMDKNSPLFENPDTREEMFTGTSFYGNSDIPAIAHGFLCKEYAVRTFGHSGDTLMSHSEMILDLDSGTGMVLMVNEANSGRNNFVIDSHKYVFGELPPGKYASDTSEKTDISGYYLNARGIHKGMLKYIGYLGAVNAGRLGETFDIGNGVYQINRKISYRHNTETRIKERSELYGYETLADGTTLLQQPDEDMIGHRYYLAELGLFTLYLLAAAAGVFLILTRLKLKKHGKLEKSTFGAVMTAGYAASILSVIILFTIYAIAYQEDLVILVTAGKAAGLMQVLCMIMCALSAAVSVIAVIKDKKRTGRYVTNTVYNGIVIAAICYFEMYRV